MRDLTYKIGDRKLWLRAWCDSPMSMLRQAWWVVRGIWQRERHHHWPESPFWTRTVTHFNATCYCPVGSITEFRFRFLGMGFWFEVQRGGPVRPCPCDIVIEEWKERMVGE